MKYRILTIDGGGLRGLIAIKILQDLENRTGKRIHEMFDLIAGTSTGGLIALGLTYKAPRQITLKPTYSLDDLEKLYLTRGKDIFPSNKYKLVRWGSDLRNYFLTRFNANGLTKVIQDYFADGARLTDCLNHLLVTTYDVTTGVPVFFKSRHALDPKERQQTNPLLKDICLATSAAPTYLPTHKMKHSTKDDVELNMIDGGVFMNNPSIGALVEMLKYSEYYVQKPKINLDDVFLLSIGTGVSITPPKKVTLNWGGKLFWASKAINLLMDGTSQAIDYQCRELLNATTLGDPNYIRLDVDIKSPGQSYLDMADSREEAVSYWLGKYENEYQKNDTLGKELDRFLINAGLGR